MWFSFLIYKSIIHIYIFFLLFSFNFFKWTDKISLRFDHHHFLRRRRGGRVAVFRNDCRLYIDAMTPVKVVWLSSWQHLYKPSMERKQLNKIIYRTFYFCKVIVIYNISGSSATLAFRSYIWFEYFSFVFLKWALHNKMKLITGNVLFAKKCSFSNTFIESASSISLYW